MMKRELVTVEAWGRVPVIRLRRPPLNVLSVRLQDELEEVASEIQ